MSGRMRIRHTIRSNPFLNPSPRWEGLIEFIKAPLRKGRCFYCIYLILRLFWWFSVLFQKNPLIPPERGKILGILLIFNKLQRLFSPLGEMSRSDRGVQIIKKRHFLGRCREATEGFQSPTVFYKIAYRK